MNLTLTFQAPAGRHLVLALLHTLWQGPALAWLVGIALRRLPARLAEIRYGLALASQLGLLLTLFLTWSWLDRPRYATVPTVSVSPISWAQPVLRPAAPVPTASETVAPTTVFEQTNWVEMLGKTWLLGVTVMAIRTMRSALAVFHLARGPRWNDPTVLVMVDRLRAELGLRRPIRVVESQPGIGPAVLGLVWPTLLLPASLLTGLTPEALRAVLAHELAHVRRHDYAANLVQMAVEAILFFNPAVWWLGRQVRLEREACCDAEAVRLAGNPLNYSRLLAIWAEQARPLGIAPAWVDQSGRSTLLNRIRRVLRPSDRPGPLPMTGPSLLALLILLPAFGLALRKGTDAAVILAAQVLSPSERLQRLKAVQAQFVTPPAGDGKATFRGRLRGPDGKPLARPAQTSVSVRSPEGGSYGNGGVFQDEFTISAPAGLTWLGVQPEDFAPMMLGPFQTRSGDVVEGLTFQLEPGFPARVRIVDELGKPVAGVQLNGGMNFHGSGFSKKAGAPSDLQGTITVPHAAHGLYFLSVDAPGFQPLSPGEAELSPDAITTLTLRHARPIRGILVNSSGGPVAGAELRLLEEWEGTNRNQHGIPGPLLAKTDDKGQFTCDRIKDGAAIAVLIEAPDQSRALAAGLRPGQDGLRLIAGIPRSIQGTVRGDRALLNPQVEYARVTITQSVKSSQPGNTIDCRWDVPVDPSGHFELHGLLPGEALIAGGGRTVAAHLEGTETVATLDLTGTFPNPAQRRVILRLKAPEGGSEPTGSLKIRVSSDSGVSTEERLTPLVHGEVALDAPIAGRVHYDFGSILGVWFHPYFAEVTPGEGPQIVGIDTLPAGAIAGQVLDTNGLPGVDGISLGVKSIDLPPEVRWKPVSLNNIQPDAEGRFFLSPLPLGGRYVVQASRGHNIQLAPETLLDAAHPTFNLTLRMPRPASASGRVLGPDGQPLTTFPLTLSLRNPRAETSWSPPTTTDNQGGFHFDDLNPELQTYRVEAECRANYQPTGADLRVGGRPIEIVLERGLIVVGRILDNETGWPIPGLEVYARSKVFQPGIRNTYKSEGLTDDAGHFRLSNLRPGDFFLGLRNANQATEREFTTPAPVGETLDIRVTLPSGSQLKPAKPSPP